ncbi:hypothetical protein ACC759_37085, partial [Rhizobium ruizarguesonis]
TSAMAMPVMTMSFAASDFMRNMNMGSSGKDAPHGHSPAQEQKLAPSWGSRQQRRASFRDAQMTL